MNPQQNQSKSNLTINDSVSSYESANPNEREFKKRVSEKNNRFSSQNLLLIAEIRDGLVIMKDGSYRAVIEAKSINYDLMSSAEQEAVEGAYQSFVNNLYFNAQIYIQSRRVDMTPYINKLSKIRGETDNMLLGMLMEDYIYFISDLVYRSNIVTKKFYVIIQYYPDSSDTDDKSLKSTKGLFKSLFKSSDKQEVIKINQREFEQAKNELRARVQSTVNGLLQMGVSSSPLSTRELVELYYNCYNPDTATRQAIKDIESTINTPVITKGEGRATQYNLNSTQQGGTE
jgi:type IV secretory pathway VirB4 component